MDLSKSFDSIPHNLLIAKMHAYGFSIDTVTFFYSDLKRCKHEDKQYTQCFPNSIIWGSSRCYIIDFIVHVSSYFLQSTLHSSCFISFPSVHTSPCLLILNKKYNKGSILGPLLFNIFINNLYHWVLKTDLLNFADDNQGLSQLLAIHNL